MGQTWMFFLLLAATTPPPQTAVLAGGSCDDAELAGYVRSFTERLRPRLQGALVEQSAAADRLRPNPLSSVDELRRQLEMAKGHFYSSDYDKAERLIDSALRDAGSLPPGEQRVKLQQSLWLLRAFVAREQRQSRQTQEAMAQIVRTAPKFEVDPLEYPPSFRAQFEAVRTGTQKAPRKQLSVRSSPAGAEVFVDGHLMGKTPLHVSLPAGTYPVEVAKDGARSFVRQVNLAADAQVHVDLEFEGAVRSRPVLCIDEGNDEALLTKAVRLGAQLDVEQLALLKLQRSDVGPTWVTTALVSIERGQKTREGGFKTGDDRQTEVALADLAEFVATGQRASSVVVISGEASAAPWAPPPAQAVAAPGPSRGPLDVSGLRRIVLYSGAGVAVVGAATAGIVRLTAQGEIDELAGRTDAQGSLAAGDARAAELVQSLEGRGAVITVALVAMGTGVASAAAALFWPKAAEERAPAVSVGTDGRTHWAAIHGSF